MTSPIGVSFDVTGATLVEQLLDYSPGVEERHRPNLLGVRADDHDRCVGGHLVERLEPGLEASDVAGKQVLGSVVHLERGEVDEQEVGVDDDVTCVAVEDVIGHQDRRYLDGQGCVVVVHLKLVRLQSDRLAPTNSSQPTATAHVLPAQSEKQNAKVSPDYLA